MFSALFSFLGGSVFRMVWGEVSSFINKKQDHSYELEFLKLQGNLDGAKHDRDIAMMKMQSDLGIKTIEMQSAADSAKASADAFTEAMRSAWKPTGVAFVDAWNGAIRPAAATVVLILWSAKLMAQGFTMDAYDLDISGVVLGFFFADRGLSKRGK